jgi:hypothetical protein
LLLLVVAVVVQHQAILVAEVAVALAHFVIGHHNH